MRPTPAGETSDGVSLLSSIHVSAIVGGHTQCPWLAAVVQLGHCSGTLVTRDVVLTSAHCLDGPIDHVTVDSHPMGVRECRRHPGYQPAERKHDIGYCRLEAAVAAAPIALDDRPVPVPGAPVSIAGFGQTDAFTHDDGLARMVETSVARTTAETFDVGTGMATACLGDSGGPVVVQRPGGVRVVAVIHGGAEAICASSTQGVSVWEHRAWLQEEINPHRSRRLEIGATAALAAATLFLAWRWMVRFPYRPESHR